MQIWCLFYCQLRVNANTKFSHHENLNFDILIAFFDSSPFEAAVLRFCNLKCVFGVLILSSHSSSKDVDECRACMRFLNLDHEIPVHYSR